MASINFEYLVVMLAPSKGGIWVSVYRTGPVFKSGSADFVDLGTENENLQILMSLY